MKGAACFCSAIVSYGPFTSETLFCSDDSRAWKGSSRTSGLVCSPDTRSGRNPIDHVQRRMPNLEKLEMQGAGTGTSAWGNAWGALRALSLSVALPIGELSTDLLSLRPIFMNLLAPLQPDAPQPLFDGDGGPGSPEPSVRCRLSI